MFVLCEKVLNQCCLLMTPNLFSSGYNTSSLQDGANNDLAIIAEWLKVNKLSLNIKKAHFICFSAKNTHSPCISLQIDGEAITEIDKSKFLGLIIDNKLSWKDYISIVCRKVARVIGVIIKARKKEHTWHMSIWLPGEGVFLSPNSYEGQYDKRCAHKITLTTSSGMTAPDKMGWLQEKQLLLSIVLYEGLTT